MKKKPARVLLYFLSQTNIQVELGKDIEQQGQHGQSGGEEEKLRRVRQQEEEYFRGTLQQAAVQKLARQLDRIQVICLTNKNFYYE